MDEQINWKHESKTTAALSGENFRNFAVYFAVHLGP